MPAPRLSLGFELSFEELYTQAGLARLDARFLEYLAGSDTALSELLRGARDQPARFAGTDGSELLLSLGPHVESFVISLFRIDGEARALEARHRALAPIFHVKRAFVQRRAAKAFTPAAAAALDDETLLRTMGLPTEPGDARFELLFAQAVTDWQRQPAASSPRLDAALGYAAWALYSESGRKRHGAGALFQVPHKLDPQRLVPVELDAAADLRVLRFAGATRADRNGFDLTDAGCDLAGALDQASYCIGCHRQRKDSCSKGLRDAGGEFRRNALGVSLAGCPLEERISEFLMLQAEGLPIAALAMIMIDNPMVAATGHRICNDCMKSCIYQKQDPVNIPQAESRALRDVLDLPWGFEIYSLLSRWNPLNVERPAPREPSGFKVLVVGLGPAGFTLSHHLLNEGHTVVAVDGLKIEPMPGSLSGVDPFGRRVPFDPVAQTASLYRALSERVMGGFGGVAEYGITVRWNKNFLTLIRLMLERRASFAMIGGVRFGGTLTIDDALTAGFDHIALCMGAGRPTVIPIRSGLARGVRQASDFLMALQLTGAARPDSLANLQVRLPIVVIGGGLTAIDTATESLAYYPVQIERFLARYETLAAQHGERYVRDRWPENERLIVDELINHARVIRAEKERAANEGRDSRTGELLRRWGGATIVYRRRLTDAPCYRLNHEEVAHAMREGVRFLECATPVAIETDEFGHARSLRVTTEDGAEHPLPARTILIATGTQPNTVLADEEPTYLKRDGRYFRAVDETGTVVGSHEPDKPAAANVLTSRLPDGRAISFFGDLHPSFAGNVVKAMASAKRGSAVISACLSRRAPTPVRAEDLVAAMNDELRAVVERVERLTPTIIEVVVRAPRAARRFQPGQFFRLQNFEAGARRLAGTTVVMEGMALTGASVDGERGIVSLIALEMGGSSKACRALRRGDPVVLMGPTGEPTVIPRGQTLCLVGGGLGNAVLFSIGQAARARGNRVVYFAGYKRRADRFKAEQIEAAADVVIWCCEEAPGLRADRPGDRTFVGNVVESMHAYATGTLGHASIPLREVDRMIVIGSDRMMAAVAAARRTSLAAYLATDHLAIGSINSPMQCMMKAICGQCLQRHRDPSTGREWVVFSCMNQDQPLDLVDFAVLAQRLAQNAVHEKLTDAWIDRCTAEL